MIDDIDFAELFDNPPVIVAESEFIDLVDGSGVAQRVQVFDVGAVDYLCVYYGGTVTVPRASVRIENGRPVSATFSHLNAAASSSNAPTVDIGSRVRLVDAVGVVALVMIVAETGREYVGECRALGVYIIPRHAVEFDADGAYAAEFQRDELPAEPVDASQVW